MTRGSSSTRFSSLTRTNMPAASIAVTKSDSDCCGIGTPLLVCECRVQITKNEWNWNIVQVAEKHWMSALPRQYIPANKNPDTWPNPCLDLVAKRTKIEAS